MSSAQRLPRFNIAAVPIDSALHDVFFRAAESMEEWMDGYKLAQGVALPHMTLCQFRAQTSEQALHLTKDFAGRELCVKNSGIYITAGKADHKGKIWIGYITERMPQVIAIQAQIVDHLRSAVPTILNEKGDDYFPHFTLIRAGIFSGMFDQKLLLSPPLIENEIKCCIRLGLSDENGQFLNFLDRPL